MNEKISVITVSYNQGEFIEDTIVSVLDQKDPNFEHIVIDGGSTDSTIDVLKKYDHLNWVSEPDRGQSHALNKGFKKASGDYIVWLNSDDYLAPGTFSLIREELKENDILITPASQTDKEKNPTELIENFERSWFDLLKFWVPFSWLAQPSVFFRKSALERVVRADGNYIDENLFYVMDFDLWMRLFKSPSKITRSDHLSSYYRVYESNKTGADGEAVQRECSRVFRRYSRSSATLERTISYVVPVQTIGAAEEKFVSHLSNQSLLDAEVLFVGYGEAVENRKLLKAARAIDGKYPQFLVRYVESNKTHKLEALNSVACEAVGHILFFAEASSSFTPNIGLSLSNLFNTDWLGLVLPYWEDKQSRSLGVGDTLENRIENSSFGIRRSAFFDLGGFRYPEFPQLAYRDLFTRAIVGSWHIVAEPSLLSEVLPDMDRPEENEESFVRSRIISSLYQEAKKDPFTAVREKSGNQVEIDTDTLEQARNVLAQAPEHIKRVMGI